MCRIPSGDLAVALEDVAAVGFELWQVKAGSVFDNIFLGESLADAEDHWNTHFPLSVRETEALLLKNLKQKEEEEHKETTRRIMELRREQDAQLAAQTERTEL